MPSKKKKYNARFPAGRIKKIMQSDEEVGKVAQAVPIIISKTLELFVESLLEKTLRITNSRNAKTLSPSHMKQCIMAENRFDFLRELVKNIPDISVAEEIAHDQAPYDLSMPSTSGVTVQIPSAPPTPSPSTGHHPSLRNGIGLNSATPPVQRSASVPTARSSSDQKRLQDLMSEMKNVSDISTIQQHSSETFHPINASASSKSGDRKRRHDDFIGDMNNVSANFYKENSTIQQHTSDMLERASPKISRMMDTMPIPHASNSSSTNSIRRLQHQSKSIPCTSKESHLSPMTPAPIINIDICNRPIVKIDYSNLALHDKELIDCSASTEDKSFASTSCISPVINIDLSKITPQPSSSLQNVLKDKATNSSSLELDEDYDNI